MNKEEIFNAAWQLIFVDSRDLSRQEYKELLQEISSQCQDALKAMEEEEE